MNSEIFLTDACNLRCTFCGAWNQDGIVNDFDPSFLKKYIEDLSKMGQRYLAFSGGEPFLYPHLYDIVQFANQLGMYTQITTNGSLIDDAYISFVSNKNIMTRISLHSLEEKKFEELVGVDILPKVDYSIKKLKENHIPYAISATISKKNMDEIEALISYAYENDAKYIRFTPVYQVYQGTSFAIEEAFFLQVLEIISDYIVHHADLVKIEHKVSSYVKEKWFSIITKPCAAASPYYHALNPDLDLVACPILAHYFDLPREKYRSTDSLQDFRNQYKELFASISVDQLEGRCGVCLYKGVCKGGCLSTKLEKNLQLTEEQPICIKEIVENLLQKYSHEDQEFLLQYWLGQCEKKKIHLKEVKSCIRRLPMWEIHFTRPKVVYSYKNMIRS